MICSMTEQQLAFWNALLAPFAEHELSRVPARGSKRELIYIDKRALANRLDSVCGPHGWFPEYEATARGFKCRLSIQVPMSNGAWVWMAKEDGAGFEEMGSTNRTTGQWEPDVDNDEKSGYTNAFRRAAQDAWGIGRYLYRKGSPLWLNPSPTPSVAAPTLAPASAPRAEAGGAPAPNSQCPVSTNGASSIPFQANGNSASPPQTQSNAQPSNQPRRDNFRIPRPGKSVFAWAKEMERTFETNIVGGMMNDGDMLGYGTDFRAWNADQAEEVCNRAIDFIITLPNYKGQFAHLRSDRRAPSPPQQQPVGGSSLQPGNILGNLKRELVNKMTALIERQIGRKPTNHELRASFNAIAPQVPNGYGSTGEIPESLCGLNDAVWVGNMIQFMDDQIRQSVANRDDGGDPIPF
jgi:hypothetical protein